MSGKPSAKNPAQIAAAIAAELREHPERWMRCDTKLPSDEPEAPRCLVGLIQKQLPSARADAALLEAFAQFVPEIPGLGNFHLASRLAVSLFAWNDSHASVEDVIQLCDKVARLGILQEIAA